MLPVDRHNTVEGVPFLDGEGQGSDAAAGTATVRMVHLHDRTTHYPWHVVEAVHRGSTSRSGEGSTAEAGTASTVHPYCRLPSEEGEEGHVHRHGPRRRDGHELTEACLVERAHERTDLLLPHGCDCRSFHVQQAQGNREVDRTLQDNQDEDGGDCRHHRHLAYRTLPEAGDVPRAEAVPNQEGGAVQPSPESE